MSNRRIFLQQAALIGAGVLANPVDLFSKPNQKVGLQLYTLRDQISKDVHGVIAKVADIGFREVETYGYSLKGGFWGLNIKEFKSLLKSHGLKSPSGHYNFDPYLGNNNLDSLKENIEAAQGIGQKYLTVPYLSEPLRKNLDSYKVLAAKLNQAAILARKAGLQLVYHNHDFEFKDFNGTTGYDILLRETDPSDLKFELDIYWTVKAGKDPIALFEQSPGRYVMWHVKDMDKTDKSYTEVGSGTIDYKQIFAKAKLSGMKHFFVEQDVIKIDHFQSITRSFQHVKGNIL
ncbi:sugar phosphate isomerase/epimerase family protein [Daejeonella lutea]|uniref:Sugar phosphate isomerase/epimerase n=1 Tax=Daejeonella lutea TaxID=572036 RepID=A0A1T5F7E9_9SPHI|nr:sugar phosphate isomerase/epimerase [Daejeonella lutea]SKB92099.1 Sugar phosphate isomerase/epimerase [Daejeonella lutea]